MTVVADTVTHTLEVVLKAFAEKHVAMIHDMMEQEKERVDQDMIDLRKTMHKQMKKNNAKRDANDIERDAKDAQRDALIVALQGELYNVKKRVAGVTNQDGTAPKMQRTWPTNITNNGGGSKPWGYKEIINKIPYIKTGFYTMAEPVTALDIVLKAHPWSVFHAAPTCGVTWTVDEKSEDITGKWAVTDGVSACKLMISHLIVYKLVDFHHLGCVCLLSFMFLYGVL